MHFYYYIEIFREKSPVFPAIYLCGKLPNILEINVNHIMYNVTSKEIKLVKKVTIVANRGNQFQ